MPDWKRQAAAFPQDETARRRLLRSLMNVRPPMPLKPEFLDVQDALLSAEREERGRRRRRTRCRPSRPIPGWFCGRETLPA